jgi:hypothetical protein
LKYISTVTEIVTTKRATEISLQYKIIENATFDYDKKLEYIKYSIAPNEPMIEINPTEYYSIIDKGEKGQENIIRSVGIAAMVTTQAMIYMDKFINLPDNKCYYTDTDSTFLEKPLDHKYIGNELGKFKFEGLIKRGYFISPKLYCLVMDKEMKGYNFTFLKEIVIIKSKGIPSKFLTEKDFKEMLQGTQKNV